MPAKDELLEQYNTETALKTAVKEAQMMIRFASEHKRVLESQHIKAVGTIHRTLKTEVDPTPQEEVAFWVAYEKIATAIAPASVESILMTRGLCDDITGESATRSPAGRKVRWYKWITITTFVVLFMVQMFWFVGNQIVKDVETSEKSTISLENKIETTRMSFEQDIANAETGKFPSSVVIPSNVDKADQSQWVQESLMKSSHVAITPLQNRLDDEINMREAAYFNLKLWNQAWSTPILLEPLFWDQLAYDSLNPDSQLRIIYKGAQSALQILSELILPLLFALLGSAVFVLRNISQHIEANDLSSSRLARMSSRLILGMISGVAMSWLTMSWFIMPDAAVTGDAKDISQNLGLLKSLGPWLTAFVAGYSVEILFSLMDTIVQAFTKKSPPTAGQ